MGRYHFVNVLCQKKMNFSYINDLMMRLTFQRFCINTPSILSHFVGSMSSYITTARENIRYIVEHLVASEKSDIRLALVEYRDHPPEDRTFVTRTHNFTASVSKMRKWLDDCRARGGGDLPEAVADALHDVVRLKWRENATKICVLISDAPPHGIGGTVYDRFPNGSPSGIDPMEAVQEMAQNGITLYSVGCEPAIMPYREFFRAIAYVTGGQYVPLTAANLLTQVIIGGAQEEMSLERFMLEVHEEVKKEMKKSGEINRTEMTKRVHAQLQSRGATTKQLQLNQREISGATSATKMLSECKSLTDIRKKFTPNTAPVPTFAPISRSSPFMLAGGIKRKAAEPLATSSHAKRRRGFSVSATKGARGGRTKYIAVKETTDSYETVEVQPQLAQVERMVQKALMRNEGKKKGGMGLKKGGKRVRTPR